MPLPAIIVLAVIAVIAFIVIVTAISKLLIIAAPNEVIVLSGRQRKTASGEVVGYRMIRGGRAIRIPFLEKYARMSLETIPIELHVNNAYSKGGIPLSVEAIANIKIDSKEPNFGNAVERFLTMKEEEIHRIAKDNLEGNLRGVLAALTPEEVNEDRMKFAEILMEEADIDLQKLGLQLDTLKITNISDERGYLDSIGRMKTAEVIARAKKAEADKKAEAEEAEALGLERGEKAKTKARLEIEKAQIDTEQGLAIANSNKEAAAQEAQALAKERAEKAKALARQQIEAAQIESEQNVLITKSNKTAEAREADALAEERAEKAKALARQQIEAAQIEAAQNVEISKALKLAEAREAEATAKERAEKADANAKREIEIAKIEAEKSVKISKAQTDLNVEVENNKLRVKKAELEKDAVIKEQEALVAGEKAKAQYEQEMEEERIILQQKRLAADVVEPAVAKKQAMELEAKGAAASIIENGEAEILVLRKYIETYAAASEHSEKALMIKILPELTDKFVSTVKDIRIDKLTMVDSGNGSSGLNNMINKYLGSVVQLSDMVENATGLDIFSQFKKNNGNGNDKGNASKEGDSGETEE